MTLRWRIAAVAWLAVLGADLGALVTVAFRLRH
jgi:hypothetical protein